MTVDEATWRVARVAREYGATVQQIADAISEVREQEVTRALVLQKTAQIGVGKAEIAFQQEARPTLETFAQQRAEDDRTIAVWVEGDPSARVSGRAIAVHVAYLLTDDESKIVEPMKLVEDAAINRGDTLLLTFEAGLKGINQLRNRLNMRVNESNVVVHAPEIPAWAHRFLDVHVTTHGLDDPVEVTRYKHQDFEDRIYEIPMAGLVEVGDGE